jgi:dihydroorotase
LQRAPFGVIGLETAFSACNTYSLVHGPLTLGRLIDAISIKPREIFGLETVGLVEGSRADLVLVDLDREWVVDPEFFQSKARNCPFAGITLTGKVLWTMYRGKIAWHPDI